MTLNKSEGDGYFVISDSGKRYGLYEMKTIGTPDSRTTDCVAIRYESKENATDEELINFVYGVKDIENSTDFIRSAITAYESEHFPFEPNLEGDLVKVF